MMNANELINILAQSIAQQQFDSIQSMIAWQDRQLTILDEAGITEAEVPSVKSYMSLSNYTCPICGVTDLQPLQRKWLFSSLAG